MNDVSKVIKIAEEQVGYLEKKSNKDLDSKTANAGSGNYTKYGRDLVKWIGSPYANGVAWCDMFVDWCFIEAYGLETAKKMIGGWSAYTPTSASYFKNMGRWSTKPQKGDQIFFKNGSGTICHTGIVYAVDNNYVYTIEGNTSGASGVIANGGGVCKKKYSRSYTRIAGYGRPNYDISGSTPTPTPKPEPKPKSKAYTGTFPSVPPTLKKGSKGIQVERLQEYLNWFFGNKVTYNKAKKTYVKLETDGIFGSLTEAAVLRFQERVFTSKEEHDGKFGKNSLAVAKTIKK